MLTLFRDPRYRLLWIHVAFGDLGAIMFFMVQGWLVLTMTDSPFWVGATAGVHGLGVFVPSIFMGVLVDRLDRQKLIVRVQLLQAVMIACLSMFILTNNNSLMLVLLVGFVDGLVIAIRLPARMALTLDLVGNKRLLNATAANSTATSIVGIVAPLLAGGVISILEIGWTYMIIAAGYVIAALTVNKIRIESTVRVDGTQHLSHWDDFKRGINYVGTTPVVRTLILMALVIELFGWAHETILPVMVRDELGSDASGLGYLRASAGLGAFGATVVLANIGNVRGKYKMLIVGYGGFGLSLTLFAGSPWLPLSMILLGSAYAIVLMYEIAINTLLQTAVPNEMRGRVLSFQILTWGISEVSGFHTGALARFLGAPLAIAIGGCIVLLDSIRIGSQAARFPEDQ